VCLSIRGTAALDAFWPDADFTTAGAPEHPHRGLTEYTISDVKCDKRRQCGGLVP
jgi:hypothetical protein